MDLLPFDQRGAWRRYTTADGLAANQTEHIVEDHDGYLWIATVTGGVSRFDGGEFRTYSRRHGLPADAVYSLLVDDRGRLWCGTYRGACLFDGDCFHLFEQQGCPVGEGITFLFKDRRGWVWLQGWNVFGYWDGECYTDLAPHVEALAGRPPGIGWGICEDDTGAIWTAGRRHTVRWSGGRLERVLLPQGPEHQQMWETCLAAHPHGGVWHSDGRRIGIWRDGRYEDAGVEITGFVRKILPDRQGRTWFCLSGGDLAALVWEGGRLAGLSATQVGYDRVHAMCEDREGNLWFATWGGGLTCFDPAGPFVLSAADGLPNPQAARIAQDRDRRLWVGFGDPYSSVAGYLHGGRFCVVPGTARHAAGLLARSDGSVWLAGAAGISRWADGCLQTVLYTDSIRPGSASRGRTYTCLAEGDQGRLVLGWRCETPQAEIGITEYDGAAARELFAMVAPDRFSAVVDVVPTTCGLWFAIGAHVGQGLGHGLGLLARDGTVTIYGPADGLVHEGVEALHVDRAGRLWIATRGGVSRLDGRCSAAAEPSAATPACGAAEGRPHTFFTNYTIDNGLPHNHVRSIAEDEAGGLWFGTDAGVARFDGKTFQLVHLGVGSPIRAMARDHTGQWWFATMDGLVGYRTSGTPPRVRMVQTIAERA
ncbi:MAG: two-component regulator propeller domain-containing protein [Candidatus Latescibacterota bacterium]